MLLGIQERLVAISVLPNEADFATWKILNDARQALAPTEQEWAEFGIEQVGNAYKWKPEIDTEREIEIGPKAHTIIQDALTKLNAEKKLTVQHLALYEKFVK